MIKISFPDGAIRQFESGVTAMDIAKSISEGLARKVLAAGGRWKRGGYESFY
jgi:threonyl-tRNA synthetase